MSIPERRPASFACPICGAPMQHVKTLVQQGVHPELWTFRCERLGPHRGVGRGLRSAALARDWTDRVPAHRRGARCGSSPLRPMTYGRTLLQNCNVHENWRAAEPVWPEM